MFHVLFTIWWEIVCHCVHKLHHKCVSQIIYKGHDADSSLEGNYQANRQHPSTAHFQVNSII